MARPHPPRLVALWIVACLLTTADGLPQGAPGSRPAAPFVSLRPATPAAAPGDNDNANATAAPLPQPTRAAYDDQWPVESDDRQAYEDRLVWPFNPITASFLRQMWSIYNLTNADRRGYPLKQLPDVAIISKPRFPYAEVIPAVVALILTALCSYLLYNPPVEEDITWESQKLFKEYRGNFENFWAATNNKPPRVRAQWIAQMCMMAGDFLPKYFDVNGIIDVGPTDGNNEPTPTPEEPKARLSSNWRPGIFPVSLNGKVAAGRGRKDKDMLESSLSDLMKLKRQLASGRGSSFLEVGEEVQQVDVDQAVVNRQKEKDAAQRCWKRLKSKELHRADLKSWMKNVRIGLKALSYMMGAWAVGWMIFAGVWTLRGFGYLKGWQQWVTCDYAALPGRPVACTVDENSQDLHQMCRFHCQNTVDEYLYLMCYKSTPSGRNSQRNDEALWLPINTCPVDHPPCFSPWHSANVYDNYCASRSNDMYRDVQMSPLQQAMDQKCLNLADTDPGCTNVRYARRKGDEWQCFERRKLDAEATGMYCMGALMFDLVPCRMGGGQRCTRTEELLAVAREAVGFKYEPLFDGCATGMAAKTATNHGRVSTRQCGQKCSAIQNCSVFEMTECESSTVMCAGACITYTGLAGGSLRRDMAQGCKSDDGKMVHRVYQRKREGDALSLQTSTGDYGVTSNDDGWLDLSSARASQSSTNGGIAHRALQSHLDVCSQTKAQLMPAWWQVDLGTAVEVQMVRVKGRVGFSTPFDVIVDGIKCGTASTQATAVDVDCNVFGKTIKIKAHNSDALSLCSVDVRVPSLTSQVTAKDCTWKTTTMTQWLMGCKDGTTCNVLSAPTHWECCSEHGGRAQCPPNRPHMCAMRDCGDEHCCEEDCSSHGGDRPCIMFRQLPAQKEVERLLRMAFEGSNDYCADEDEQCACNGIVVFARTNNMVHESILQGKYAAKMTTTINTTTACTAQDFGLTSRGNSKPHGCYCLTASAK